MGFLLSAAVKSTQPGPLLVSVWVKCELGPESSDRVRECWQNQQDNRITTAVTRCTRAADCCCHSVPLSCCRCTWCMYRPYKKNQKFHCWNSVIGLGAQMVRCHASGSSARQQTWRLAAPWVQSTEGLSPTHWVGLSHCQTLSAAGSYVIRTVTSPNVEVYLTGKWFTWFN